jgi:hypothetical protein
VSACQGFGSGPTLLTAERGSHRGRHRKTRKRSSGEVLSLFWRARVPYWLQKSARGVGLREAASVVAEVGDGGLARVGGHRERMGVWSFSVLRGRVAKGLWRAACWWKAPWVVEGVAFHEVTAEAVLVRRIGTATGRATA